jgi:hypothetical protein
MTEEKTPMAVVKKESINCVATEMENRPRSPTAPTMMSHIQ